MDALNDLLLAPSFSDSIPSDDEEEVEHLMELCLAHGPKPIMDEGELEADAEDGVAGDYVAGAALQKPYTSMDADSDGSDTDTDSVNGGGSDADDESASEADDNSDSDSEDDMRQSGASRYTRHSPASSFFVTVPNLGRRRDDAEEDDAHRLAKRQRYTTPPVTVDPDFGELMKLLANAKEPRVAIPAAYDGPRTPQAQITHSLFKFARHH